MKKVTAIIGTQTKKNTYYAVQEFEKNLKQNGEIDFEYVFLSDYNLEFCRGCKICFDKGEEFCPIKDDRDVLLGKLEHSDGIILASPSYAFHVSARMKNFLDRLAFIIHRPRFFGKICTAVVTHAVPIGAGNVVKYLSTAGENMGFHVSKGCCVNTIEPMTQAQQDKLIQTIEKTSSRFYRELLRPTPAPSFSKLMHFRLARTSIKYIDQNYKDYQHYKEKGWFETDYYYLTSLGPVKKLAGSIFDFVGQWMFKQEMEQKFKDI